MYIKRSIIGGLIVGYTYSMSPDKVNNRENTFAWILTHNPHTHPPFFACLKTTNSETKIKVFFLADEYNLKTTKI